MNHRLRRCSRTLLALACLAALADQIEASSFQGWGGAEPAGRAGRGRGRGGGGRGGGGGAAARAAKEALGRAGRRGGPRGKNLGPPPPLAWKPKVPQLDQLALKPPTPVAEADRITAAADRRRLREAQEEALLEEHFALCDLDGNGWISLRESQITLSFDRDEFRLCDADQDGRIDRTEFGEKGSQVLARLGAVVPLTALEPAKDPPLPEPAPAAAPAAAPAPLTEFHTLFPRPLDLIGRYDADRSKGLDTDELAHLCSEVGLTLSCDLAVAQMDGDDTGQLEAYELLPIAVLVSRNLPEALRPRSPEPQPEPVTPIQDPAGPPATPSAGEGEPGSASEARSPGPRGLTHFSRLDPSDDGFIDADDLRRLQSPVRLGVRLEILLSALDRDGDGRLSPQEFHSSMTQRKPGRLHAAD